MPRYKVICGGMEEFVEADSHADAAEKLFTMFDDDPNIPDTGPLVSTIEIIGEELWHKTDDVIKRAGRWGESTDASTAEKLSPDNQVSNG